MVAHIVCGSPYLWLPINLVGYVVGVDRGALKLIEKNVSLNVAIGDFDSVSEGEYQLIRKRAKLTLALPVDKDVTDCEAAVAYVVEKGYHQIYLYGTTGGRFDHQFATMGLLLKYAKQGVQIYVEDAQNKISVLTSGMHHIEVDATKEYISFFALEHMVKNLTVRGVKYPLNGYDLAVDDSLCVSNEPLQRELGISFDSGCLVVVQSVD